MSQPHADDSDPSLAFFSEADVDAPNVTPPEPAKQLVASSVDPAPTSLPSPPIDALIARIDRVEQALADSKAQVAAVRSEQVAIVRVVNDIKKQMTQLWSPSGTPIITLGPPLSRVVSAIAGVLIGAVVVIAGWTYLGNDVDTTIAASAPPQETAFPSVPTSAAPTQSIPSPPPTSTSVASTRKSVSRPPKYIGTLLIDASPGGNVLVNRQPAGDTPLRLTNLRAGSHLIWVERDGYRRWTRVVQVPSDRVTRVSAQLEPVAAR